MVQGPAPAALSGEVGNGHPAEKKQTLSAESEKEFNFFGIGHIFMKSEIVWWKIHHYLSSEEEALYLNPCSR